MNRFHLISFILITCSLIGFPTNSYSFAQESGKSNIAKDDSIKASLILDEIDSLYFSENYNKALEVIEKSIPIFNKLNKQSLTDHAIIRRASIYRSYGEYGKALTDFNIVLQNQRLRDDKKGEASSLNHIGAVYRLRGDYPTALDYYFKSLKLYQDIDYKQGISNQLNNIGVVHLFQKLYDKALEYYLQSLKIEEEIKDEEGIGISYLNIGEIYRKKKDYNKAIDYYLKALVYANKINDLDATGTIYNEIAGINIEQGQVNDVLTYLDKAKESFITLGEKSRLAECEMNYGSYYLTANNSKQALDHYQEALRIAKEIGSLEVESNANKQLSIVFDKIQNTNKAYSHYKSYISTRDSLFNEDNTRKSIQAEMFYKFERQQEASRIEQAKKEAIFIAKSQRQKLIRNLLLVVVFLSAILISVILLSLKNIRKVNSDLKKHQNEILEKNEELQQQQEEILAQRDEIERKNFYLEESRKIIADKNDRMVSSIEYAQTIQKALLPQNEDLAKLFNDSFVIYLPKDIVSGDFYWISNYKNYTHIAVMDCTGHGVPGSFMSLIGNTLLNQIVNEWQIKNPALVLENLHEQLRKALKQDEFDTKLHASIDIGFVTINHTAKKVLYSGANRPLIYISNGNLEKIPGDIRSTGGFQPENKRKFTNKEIDLISPSYLYLTTDGFSDQMNPSRKKFGQKQLYSLLQQIYDKPLPVQKDILINMFDNHKNGEDQLDDICIVGIKL
ncbi:MAG: tetratricopeptide repeat protein [Bacteroidales bacterium]